MSWLLAFPSAVVDPPDPGGDPPNEYPGFTYDLSGSRPFMSLAQFTGVDTGSSAYSRYKTAADNAVGGNVVYGWEAYHSVFMYAMVADQDYLDWAITQTEAMVATAEAAIAAGNEPALAGGSYLYAGNYLRSLTLTYDWGYDLLTADQRTRWKALGDQTIYNIWHPTTAFWGSYSHPWSGWAVDNPGNNYFYSFMEATMLWALCHHDTDLLSYLQTVKFPQLIDFFAAFAGGATEEGTYYSIILGRALWPTWLIWKNSLAEDFSTMTNHVKETLEYWCHATVPTLDYFAPIGDQARSSLPVLYDFNENLMRYGLKLRPTTTEARYGAWWLANNSIDAYENTRNVFGQLLPLTPTSLQPSALVYHAESAGNFFARSSWDTTATWLSVVAGTFYESHAHQDQGGFTLYKNGWQTVTSNIWSSSGIVQDTFAHNVLWFKNSGGTTIPQTRSQAVASSMTYAVDGSTVTVTADLTNAYSANSTLVQAWTRTFTFSGNTLRVADACTLGAGVTAQFQVHVPVEPSLDGSVVVAGDLRITPQQAGTVTWAAMGAGYGASAYRILFTPSSLASFAFDFEIVEA